MREFDWLVQELNSRAEGKFNRLKTQAKTKIAALNKELERLREEHGAAPQLNISAQVSTLRAVLRLGAPPCLAYRLYPSLGPPVLSSFTCLLVA